MQEWGIKPRSFRAYQLKLHGGDGLVNSRAVRITAEEATAKSRLLRFYHLVI